MILKHRTVLGALGESTTHAVLIGTDDDTGGIRGSLYLPRDIWEGMGKPETVTVTVEPGDLLNAPKEGSA